MPNTPQCSSAAVWFAITAGSLLLQLDYLLDDLTEAGLQVIVRSGSRWRWYLSKCMWNLLTCGVIVGLGLVTALVWSLGMKQRLGIAAAIIEQPELILLDEPTNALDEGGVEMVCRLICRERDRGALVVMASHDGEVLERLSDELFYIHDGIVERKVCP